MNSSQQTYCGYVAIIGRPNVGKSTLLNRILGQKISITSNKPQTTRHRLLGIKTMGNRQFIYVDTPGIHLDNKKRALNRMMNQAASYTIDDVDVVVLVIDANKWTQEDDYVIDKLAKSQRPVIVAVNKIDTIKDKERLLPILDKVTKRIKADSVIPISAKHGEQIEQLESILESYLPESPHFFPETDITDKSNRFLIAEIIREKLFRNTGDELPYATTVMIEDYKDKGKVIHISALILVEREGQKRIVIGQKGEKIKAIGKAARQDIEALLNHKVYLELWTKVRSGWADDERALRSLGYQDYE